MVFLPFSEISVLCVCHCLKDYLERTKDLRGDETQLLLSFVKPHDGIGSKAVSRWIVDVLESSGIDVKKFSGHSTRSAASSKAFVSGVPVKEILTRGYWSKESTFQKFYFKIVEENSKFENSVLTLSK